MTTDHDHLSSEHEASLRAMLSAPVDLDADDVLARAGRGAAVRRRRLLLTRAGGVALAAGLVVTGVAVLPRLAGPSPAHPDPTPTAVTASEPSAPQTDGTDATETETEPPYQPTPPTEPDDPDRIVGSQDENAWPIPDPRPTVPGPLAALPTYQLMYGPFQTPAAGLMCDATVEDAQNAVEQVPVGATSWTHLDPSAPDRSIDVVVTGWDDAALAYEEITTNSGFCIWPDGQHEVPWPASDDVGAVRYLDDDGAAAVAIELVGQYLVAVTVWDSTAAAEDRQADAVEIAELTLGNLFALDPERTS